MGEKCPWLQGVPTIVSFYLFLAIVSSAVWLYYMILEPRNSKDRRIELVLVVVAYVIHLPVVVSLPFYSRPWIQSKDSSPIGFRVWWRALGWDDDPRAHWLLEGLRPVASILLAWGPFLMARSSMPVILCLAVEGFFVAETLKHTEAEHTFFMTQMACAAYAAERAFGLASAKWWAVFSFCLFLIALRSILPLYEDASTLLPEPYLPDQPPPVPEPYVPGRPDPRSSVV